MGKLSRAGFERNILYQVGEGDLQVFEGVPKPTDVKDLEGFIVVALDEMQGARGQVSTVTYAIGVHHIDRAKMLAALDDALGRLNNTADSFEVSGEGEADGFASAVILATAG